MNTFPPDSDLGPSPMAIARSLRNLSGRAARRNTSLTHSDSDLLLSAAVLIEMVYGDRPVPAGEGAG